MNKDLYPFQPTPKEKEILVKKMMEDYDEDLRWAKEKTEKDC